MYGNEDEEESDSELDPADLNNYKGMFYNDEPGQKYQDPETGAHFEYNEMCARLKRLQKELAHRDESKDSRDAEDPKELKVQNFIEKKKIHKEKENGSAFKALQALLKRSKTKDSRNAVQALPEQGYGTSEIKDGKSIRKGNLNCARQFSSQFDGHQQLGNQQLNIIPKQSRSKSIDKQQRLNDSNLKTVNNDAQNSKGRLQQNNQKNMQKAQKSNNQTVLDMQKRIEMLLQDNNKQFQTQFESNKSRPKTKNKYRNK